ncbi:MAG: hypothetical protein ACQEQG_04645 [Bacillota bacterium]
MGDRIKSAYEIARERADRLETEADAGKLDLQSEIKPILGDFFQGKLRAEGLYEKFSDSETARIAEAQRLIVSSLGLNSSEEEIELREQGLLALEEIKDSPEMDNLKNLLVQVQQLVRQYHQEQEQLQNKLENMLRQAAGSSGQAPSNLMELVGNLDEGTRQQLQQARQQMEERFQQQWEALQEELINAVEVG